jgi:hypothetical protein
MPFTVENVEHSVVKFVFTDPMTSKEIDQVLGILDRLLDSKKRFSFYIDSRKASNPPLNGTMGLIKWLKENKSRMKQTLMSSAVIINSTIASNFLKNVFTLQPMDSPNLMTSSYEEGKKFVIDINKSKGL